MQMESPNTVDLLVGTWNCLSNIEAMIYRYMHHGKDKRLMVRTFRNAVIFAEKDLKIHFPYSPICNYP